MCIDYGKDYNYAHSRLNGSWVKFNGSFVYILSVSNSGVVDYLDKNSKDGKCHLRELDLTPIQLGYINFKRASKYVVRLPVRSYRQGIRRQNVSILEGASRNQVELGKYFWDCLESGYKKLDHCIESVYNGEKTSLSFCPDFCVRGDSNNMHLDYKGKECGKVDTGKQLLILDNKYNFLKESLEFYEN